MIECKPSDYITLTCKPGLVKCTVQQMLFKLLDTLLLDDMYKNFKVVSQNSRYEFIMRYEDIQIKVPYMSNYKTQGICVEFSGQGVDYYIEYLNHNRSGATLRYALRRFIGLSDRGYNTQASRFDVAFDEKYKVGEQVEPYLNLDRIKTTLKSGLFVTKFRKGEPLIESGELKSAVFVAVPEECDESVPYRFIQSMNLSSGRIGKTIELGKRKSDSFVRFYDKLAEQEAHGYEVPSDISHWVRFEIEYKHKNANSVMEAYAKFDTDREFVEYMRGVALDLIRFIDNDRSRKYNCTTCDWWYKFLKHADRAKLVHNKPKFNKYVRAVEGQKRQNAATLAALIKCDKQNLVSIIQEGFKKPSKNAQAIMDDHKAIKDLPPDEYELVYKKSTTPETGLEFWKRHFLSSSDSSTDEEFEEFMKKCVEALCDEVLKAV